MARVLGHPIRRRLVAWHGLPPAAPGGFEDARHVGAIAVGLPADPGAVAPVVQPVDDGAWLLKARSVDASMSGVPRQQAFYTAVGREAALFIHTASVLDFQRSVEEDAARLHREVLRFSVQSANSPGLGVRSPVRVAELSAGDAWSAGSISVDGTETAIRSTRLGEHGWIGWWVSDGRLTEIMSDVVPPSQISLVQVAA